MFFRGSRYEMVSSTQMTTKDGRVISYKRVRFIPPTQGLVPVTVAYGDRLDLIAYRVYKDSEQFWRICDGNTAMRPEDLETPGMTLLVPVPVS